MFTQCPECSTVFRVTAAVLRAAQGQVRCGVCDANFDALRFLTDAVEGEVPPPPAPPPPEPDEEPPPSAPYTRTPPAPAPAAPAPPPRPVATRTTPSADEDRELAEIAAVLARDAAALEARRGADSERFEIFEERPTATEADEVNVLEPPDVENIVLGAGAAAAQIPDTSLEFDVPPGEWDRVFVADAAADTITPLDINLSDLEPPPTDVAAEVSAAERLLSLIDAPPAARPTKPAAPAPDESAEDPLARTDSFEKLELERSGEPRATAHASDSSSDVEVEVDLGAAESDTDTPPGTVHVEDAWFDHAHGHAAPSVSTDLEREPEPEPDDEPVVAATAARAFDDEPAFELSPPDVDLLEPAPRRERSATFNRAQAAGVALLALALIAQVVHFNREAIGASEPLGAPLRALYAGIGRPIEPRWNLGAYDVKQWGAATDNAPGALRLRASVVNRAARAQPYPLLRVTLEDRFGAKVARREFTPVEYLPGHVAPATLLPPGARADADLSLADPGSQAVGFELDVCLPHGGVLTCGTEPKAPGGG